MYVCGLCVICLSYIACVCSALCVSCLILQCGEALSAGSSSLLSTPTCGRLLTSHQKWSEWYVEIVILIRLHYLCIDNHFTILSLFVGQQEGQVTLLMLWLSALGRLHSHWVRSFSKSDTSRSIWAKRSAFSVTIWSAATHLRESDLATPICAAGRPRSV